jgi:hypothetical protein
LPVILVANPKDGSEVNRQTVDVSGVAEAEPGLDRIEISVKSGM